MLTFYTAWFQALLLLVLASSLHGHAYEAADSVLVTPPISTIISDAGSTAARGVSHGRPTWGISRRGLRQTSEDVCLWNGKDTVCEPNNFVLADLLRGSKSSLAQYVLRVLECRLNASNFRECGNFDHCGWHSETGCTFVDFIGEYKESPCVRNMPRFHNVTALETRCRTRTTEAGCESIKGCLWGSVYLKHPFFSEFGRSQSSVKVCIADSIGSLLDLPSGLQFEFDRNDVDINKTTSIYYKYVVNPVTGESMLNATQLLKWEVPKTECPKGYDQLVCDYVDAYLSDLLPSTFYCQISYPIASSNVIACNTDPLCQFNSNQQLCKASYAVVRASLAEADKVLLARIPQRNDREIAQYTLHCGRILDETQCDKNCVWTVNASGGFCRIDQYFVFGLAASGAPTNTTDPVCLTMRTNQGRFCERFANEAQCSDHDSCQWNYERDACVAAVVAVSEIGKQDPSLVEPYANLLNTCLERKDKNECEEP